MMQTYDADDDYFQVDTVIVEEEESGDIQEDLQQC